MTPSIRKITPEDEHHYELQRGVARFLEMHGLQVREYGYHDLLDQEAVRQLARIKNPTAIDIRTSPDLIAFSDRMGICFEIELKTNSGPYRNMAIEAFPLGLHIRDASDGIQCLYIYRDVIEGGPAVAFWAEKSRILVDEVHIPPGWEDYEDRLKRLFPHPKITWRHGERTAGSQDPFVVVKHENISRCTCDWRKAIVGRVAEKTGQALNQSIES